MKLKPLAFALALPIFAATFAATYILPAAAQESITLRLTDPFPLTHVLSKISSQRFKELVEEKSNGQVTIRHFPAGQLTSAKGVFDAVKSGVADMGIFVPSHVSAVPLTTVAEIPGLFVDANNGAKALNQLLQNDVRDEFLGNGVVPLFGTMSAPYQLMLGNGFATDTITDISDIKGKKLQVTGATLELAMDALGAVPVRVPVADRYVALERGTVDGAIYSTSGALGHGLESVLKAATTNGSFGSVSAVMIVNEKVWEGLPEAVKSVIEEVSKQLAVEITDVYQQKTREDGEKLAAAGLTMIELSPEVQAQVNARLGTVQSAWVDQMKARGLAAEDVLTAFRGYLEVQ